MNRRLLLRIEWLGSRPKLLLIMILIFFEGDADLVVIGSGPGGYVAAIKAAQLGMNVSILLYSNVENLIASLFPDGLHWKARNTRWYMFKRGLYTIQSTSSQLASVAPSSAWVPCKRNWRYMFMHFVQEWEL